METDSDFEQQLVVGFILGSDDSDDELDSLVEDCRVAHSLTGEWKLKILSWSIIIVPLDRKKHGGSVPGKRPNISRNFAAGHQRICNDYFDDHPVYDEKTFRHRFRMSKRLFMKILRDVEQFASYLHQKSDETAIPVSSVLKELASYFTQKLDATGLLGASPFQKVSVFLILS